jgi:hypothetical protein
MPESTKQLVLTDDIKSDVNGALANGTPVVVAYVDADGAPHLSFRGSAQAYGDDRLAIWVRDPEGGLLQAIVTNPRIALLYRDPATRRSYRFAGRAHVVTDPAAADTIYSNSPEIERSRDPERQGKAVLVDLDSVEGMGAQGRFRMER